MKTADTDWRIYQFTMIAYETGVVGLVAEHVDACTEMTGELQGEALMHKTYATRFI